MSLLFILHGWIPSGQTIHTHYLSGTDLCWFLCPWQMCMVNFYWQKCFCVLFGRHHIFPSPLLKDLAPTFLDLLVNTFSGWLFVALLSVLRNLESLLPPVFSHMGSIFSWAGQHPSQFSFASRIHWVQWNGLSKLSAIREIGQTRSPGRQRYQVWGWCQVAVIPKLQRKYVKLSD